MIADRDRETPPTAATIDAPSWLRPGAPHGESGAPDSESDRAGGDPDAEDIARTPPDDSIDPAPDPAPGAADAAAPDPADDGAAPGAANAAANHAEPDTVVDPPSRPSSRGSRAAPLRRIEQFVLLERIGVGGMGEVFAAFDDKLERKVAIKLVATRGSNDRARERLLREAQALARLSHPNVVTVYEVGTLPDGELFIAMELVKGQTLRAWQRSRAGAWRDIVAKYAEAGRGLAAAHQSGIVHRDFKPDNVLVGDDGRVRVADFGLAFAREATAVAASRLSRPSGAITVVPASDPAALGLAPTESPATQP
ncbi:MAG TPA: serine/threonine-protein kinase, partial [Kofleriaceae bacterium]|nr:serine/threonine-protein kinase [Kofleriaceae bacterium]